MRTAMVDARRRGRRQSPKGKSHERNHRDPVHHCCDAVGRLGLGPRPAPRLGLGSGLILLYWVSFSIAPAAGRVLEFRELLPAQAADMSIGLEHIWTKEADAGIDVVCFVMASDAARASEDARRLVERAASLVWPSAGVEIRPDRANQEGKQWTSGF